MTEASRVSEVVSIEAGELLGHLSTSMGSADTTMRVAWLHPEEDHVLTVILDSGTWNDEVVDLTRTGGTDLSLVYMRARGLAETNAVAHCAGAYVHKCVEVTRRAYKESVK